MAANGWRNHIINKNIAFETKKRMSSAAMRGEEFNRCDAGEKRGNIGLITNYELKIGKWSWNQTVCISLVINLIRYQ